MFFGGFLLGLLLASACGLDLFHGAAGRRRADLGAAAPSDLEALLAGSREERDRLAGELARLEAEREAARGSSGPSRPAGAASAAPVAQGAADGAREDPPPAEPEALARLGQALA